MSLRNRYGVKKRKAFELFEAKWGLIFIMPWLIGFLTFYLAPMVTSAYYTFTDYNISKPNSMQFVGLENWKSVLFADNQIAESTVSVLNFAVIYLPIIFIFALGLSLLLNSEYLVGTKAFRTLFYMPSIIPLVATVLIYKGVLGEQSGWINLFINDVLDFFGIKHGSIPVHWSTSGDTIYFTYALIELWGTGNMVMLFLASLQRVPTELYESAKIDGANWRQRTFRITLPQITPIIFFNLIISLIGLFQYFLVPYIFGKGDGSPEGKTMFLGVLFFREAFHYNQLGRGSAIAWVIFGIALIVTIILFKTQKSWVYYSLEK